MFEIHDVHKGLTDKRIDHYVLTFNYRANQFLDIATSKKYYPLEALRSSLSLQHYVGILDEAAYVEAIKKFNRKNWSILNLFGKKIKVPAFTEIEKVIQTDSIVIELNGPVSQKSILDLIQEMEFRTSSETRIVFIDDKEIPVEVYQPHYSFLLYDFGDKVHHDNRHILVFEPHSPFGKQLMEAVAVRKLAPVEAVYSIEREKIGTISSYRFEMEQSLLA